MATNPDPQLTLTDLKGTTRTLTEWTTIFQLCLVILPDRPEGERFIPVAKHIFATFREANVHTAYVVPSTASIAKRILGGEADSTLTFVDPDRAFVNALGLTHLPAFVHLRQDTTVGEAAEGWNPRDWQRVAVSLAKDISWSSPDLLTLREPAPTAGWALDINLRA